MSAGQGAERESRLPTHELNISTLPKKGHRVSLEAGVAELVALAQSSGVDAMSAFKVEVTVKPWHRDGTVVEGEIATQYEQTCVVSLEPIKQEMVYPFSAKFVSENSKLSRNDHAADGEVIVAYEGEDIPETVSGDVIDLWQVALEFFILELDPYPRIAGAGLDAKTDGEDPGIETSPFAVLKSLKHSKT